MYLLQHFHYVTFGRGVAYHACNGLAALVSRLGAIHVLNSLIAGRNIVIRIAWWYVRKFLAIVEVLFVITTFGKS